MTSSCTHPNAQPGDLFCDDCGLRLTPPAATNAVLHCPCGAAYQPGDKFCDVCGATLHHAQTPRPKPAAIPFVAPSARNATRCVQCGAATIQSALLCPLCQQRAASPATPPSGPAAPAVPIATPTQQRSGGPLIGVITLILVIGGVYISSLKSQNARLQAQAQVQPQPISPQPGAAPVQPAPQYSPPRTYVAPTISQPPADQSLPAYLTPPPEMERAMQQRRAEQEAMLEKQRAEDNALVVWECEHCRRQVTRAKKDGAPHNMFDTCPALNWVKIDGTRCASQRLFLPGAV